MNAFPESPMMDEFLKALTIISQTTDGTSVQSTQKPCIDYILQLNNKAKAAKVVDSKVIKNAQAGDMKIASDHYPVYVDVIL